MTISERIFYLLDQQQKTQKDLSRYTGIKSNTISDWKRKKTNPSSEKIMRICDFFDISPEWLLTGKGNMYKTTKNNSITSDETILLSNYRKLNAMDQGRILERIKTTIELREETEKRMLMETSPAAYKVRNKVMPLSAKKPEEDIPLPVNDSEEEIAISVGALPAAAGIGNYLIEDDLFETYTFMAGEVPGDADFGIRMDGDSMEPLINNNSIVWVKSQPAIDDGQIGIFIFNRDAYCKKLDIDHENRQIRLISLNHKYEPIVVSTFNNLRTVGRVLL